MSQEIRIDPSIVAPLVNYYADQEHAITETRRYLEQYGALRGGRWGLLGLFAKPYYGRIRDTTFEAFEAIDGAVRGLREQTAAALNEDLAAYEQQVKDGIGEEEIDTPTIGGGTGGTGGSVGSFGGGGYGGGGGGLPDFGDSDDDGNLDISISVDADGNVDVDVDADGIDDANINIDIDTDSDGDAGDPAGDADVATDDDTASAGGGGGGGGGGGEAPTAADDPLGSPDQISGELPPEAVTPEDLDAELTPEELAAREAYYDELWQELAANDPRGRTADELRLAWESRDAYVAPASAPATGIGYEAGDGGATEIPVDFTMFAAATGGQA